MSWSAPVPIFEDEDEAELIARFVEYSARYPKRSAYELCQYIFKDLREPDLRAGQAAAQWSQEIDILERIRLAQLNGGTEPKPLDTKEEKLRKLEAVYDDTEVSMKDRLAAMRLHAEIQGEITKAIEKKTTDLTPRFPRIVHAVYAD